MDRMRIIALFLLLTFAFQLSIHVGSFASPSPVEGDPYDYATIFSEINVSAVMEHVSYFASLGSRVTGYSGSDVAADYIAEKFREFGLQPINQYGFFEPYNVTVPIDRGASITVLPNGPRINAYALWPNQIQASQTPPEGISGCLLYVHEGELGEITSQAQRFNVSLKDCIILSEFNTWDRWVDAAKFGAKAVVFIEPDNTHRLEAEKKFLMTPLSFPRLYVSKVDGAYLKGLAKTGLTNVQLVSSMRYENVVAKNVVGVFPGKEGFQNDIVVFTSYYDCWSIVPRLAPGADEATGIATLLELARMFTKHPPLRTVWFVAFSGHWQGVAGARDFVETHYFDPAVWITGEKKIWALINLDFSTDSPTLAWTAGGSMYSHYAFFGLFDVVETARMESDIENALARVGFNYTKYVERWGIPAMFTNYFHDAEPAVVAGGCAFTLRTSRSMRDHWGHPLSTIDTVNPSNLDTQMKVAFAVTYTHAMLPDLGLRWGTGKSVKPERRYTEPYWSKGFAGVIGDVTRYDPSTRWYTFEGLENYDIIIDMWVAPSTYNPFTHFIVKVNPDGTFKVKGVGADVIYTSYVGLYAETFAVTVRGYAINRTTGQVEWATDQGVWMWPQLHFANDRAWKEVRVALFRAESVMLYDILDPRSIQTSWLDPNWRVNRGRGTVDPSAIYLIPLTVEVRDFKTHGIPLKWGLIPSSETGEPHAMLFLPPDLTFEVVLTAADAAVGILNNADANNPQGVGFKVESITGNGIYVPFQCFNDMYWLNRQRLNLMRGYAIISYLADYSQEEAMNQITTAYLALETSDYDSLVKTSITGWAWDARAYGEVKYLLYSLTYTSLFFAILLVPFAFLSERLFIPLEGRRRIASLAIAFIIPFIILYLVHPGYQLALNIPVAVEGYVLVFFAFVVVLMLSGEVGSFLREIRARVVGLHFAEISRISALMMALSTGIEQMRRRRFRTVLTLTTLILITFTFIALTSATGVVVVRPDEWPIRAKYNGLLIEVNRGNDPVSDELIEVTQTLLGGSVTSVARRAWIYPPPGTVQSMTPPLYPIIRARVGERTFDFYGALGLHPEETSFTDIPSAFVDLQSRWFEESDYLTCLISKEASEALGVGLGGIIFFGGLPLTIIGTFDGGLLRQVTDLSGQGLAPIDYVEGQRQMRFTSVITLSPEMLAQLSRYRLPFDRLLVVPFALAQKVFYAPVRSVAIRVEDPNIVHTAAEKLMSMTGSTYVYVGAQGKTYLYTKYLGIVAFGWQLMWMPLIISVVIMFNVMLSSVYERVREIGILASIGLAPIHVAGMFFAESLVYSVVGSTVGYTLGIVASHLLVTFKLLPEQFIPNFASTFVVMAITLSVLVVLASTAYPMVKASRLVTPSLERRFRLRMKPRGEEMTVAMPFVATGDEVPAILAFMKEYMEGLKVEHAGPFSTLDIPVYKEETVGWKTVQSMEAKVALAPYDANVSQLTRLVATRKAGEERYTFEVYVRMLTGASELWRRANAPFTTAIRTQLLIWRGLREDEKTRYFKLGSELTTAQVEDKGSGGA